MWSMHIGNNTFTRVAYYSFSILYIKEICTFGRGRWLLLVTWLKKIAGQKMQEKLLEELIPFAIFLCVIIVRFLLDLIDFISNLVEIKKQLLNIIKGQKLTSYKTFLWHLGNSMQMSHLLHLLGYFCSLTFDSHKSKYVVSLCHIHNIIFFSFKTLYTSYITIYLILYIRISLLKVIFFWYLDIQENIISWFNRLIINTFLYFRHTHYAGIAHLLLNQ